MDETYDPKFKGLENAQMEQFCTTQFHGMNNGAGDILNWLTGLRSAETRTRVVFQSGTIFKVITCRCNSYLTENTQHRRNKDQRVNVQENNRCLM